MKKKLLYILLPLFAFTFNANVLSATKKKSIAVHKKKSSIEITIKAFIQHMTQKYHLDQKQLEKWLIKTSPDQKVLHFMSKPYEQVVTWDVYRDHFITPARVNSGVQFWKAHQKILKAAEKKYGVPAYIIVGVLGVETNYGKVKMHFKALNSLVTLAFYYPPRSSFFKQELEEYLVLTHEHNIPPETLYSSYAGALGIPQFMPSCYRKFSVSAHPNKKKADLISDVDDAIFSVANYLKVRGQWKPNTPIILPASSKRRHTDKLCSTDAKLIHTVEHYKKLGIQPTKVVNLAHKTALLLFIYNNHAYYWFAFKNFSAIMAYNPRVYYAMTVYQLGKAVQQKIRTTTAKS